MEICILGQKNKNEKNKKNQMRPQDTCGTWSTIQVFEDPSIYVTGVPAGQEILKCGKCNVYNNNKNVYPTERWYQPIDSRSSVNLKHIIVEIAYKDKDKNLKLTKGRKLLSNELQCLSTLKIKVI